MPLCSFRTVTIAISKQEHTTETAYNKHTPMCFVLVRLMNLLHANEIPSVYIGKEQQAIDQSVPSRERHLRHLQRHYIEHAKSGTYDSIKASR